MRLPDIRLQRKEVYDKKYKFNLNFPLRIKPNLNLNSARTTSVSLYHSWSAHHGFGLFRTSDFTSPFKQPIFLGQPLSQSIASAPSCIATPFRLIYSAV